MFSVGSRWVRVSGWVVAALVGAVGCAGGTSFATVTGTGDVEPGNTPKWSPSTTGYVGNSADGDVSVDGGSTLQTLLAFVGYQAGVTGTVAVDGPGSVWTVRSAGRFINGDTEIGHAGTGVLTITNGAQVNDLQTYLAEVSGSTGIVTVDGFGSLLTAGFLNVGYAGTGTLNITNGGTVNAAKTFVAPNSGAVGTINFGANGGTLTATTLYASPTQVTGTGTINTQGLVSDGDLVFDAARGPIQTLSWNDPGQRVTVNLSQAWQSDLGAGYVGRGSLTISDGVTVSCTEGSLGYGAGSTGTAMVSGAGSTWKIVNAGSLYVGYSGIGVLNITGGAAVTVAKAAYVAPNNGSTGAISFGAGGGTLTAGALYASPSQVTGVGTINANGLVTDGDFVVDAMHGMSPTLTWSGPGQNVTVNVTWGTMSDLGVGYLSRGTLTIQNTTLNSAAGYLGYKGGAVGTATVSGAGSTWASYEVYIGYSGTGVLNISNGARVSSGGYIGYNTGSTGTVTVDGAGSTWTGSDELYVGYQGTGALMITNGGTVVSDFGHVGYDDNGSAGPAATGTVTVDGPASAWSNTGDLNIGYNSAGTLNINNGAVLTVGGATYLGSSTGTGTLNFGGSGGTLTTQTLYFSAPGQVTGTGKIKACGWVADGDLVLDATHGLSRTVTWTGADQNVTVQLDVSGASGAVGDLGAGYTGGGTLTIRDGVAVTSANGCLGYGSGAAGTATVMGPGSAWNIAGELIVGSLGAGVLNITRGGKITALSCYVGGPVNALEDHQPSTSTVIVDGVASTLSGSIYVGDTNSGNLHITNGGTVNGSGYFGYNIGSTGIATIDGLGSVWNGALFVGVGGIGRLTITNGGKVNGGSNNADIGVQLEPLGFYVASPVSAGTVTVDGAGSAWTNIGSLGLGYTSGTGVLIIVNGGTVTAVGVSIATSSLVAMSVGDGSLLNVETGGVTNNGTIRLRAVSEAAGGATYSPIVAGSWSGTGVVQTLGGTWDPVAHVFTVSGTANGSSGQAVTIDPSQVQRVVVVDPGTGGMMQAGFMPTVGPSSLTFTAASLTASQAAVLQNVIANSGTVVTGWTFSTDGYTTGTPVSLAMDIGPGYAEGNLAVWHFDGSTWTPYAAGDLSYDGEWASFTVTGFSGYAVESVPEPGTLGLAGLGAVGLLGKWRRRARSPPQGRLARCS